MTTSPTPRERATPADRVADYLLDVDGTIYGDERERIRWYEGISVAASFQWLAVPWAMAIMVWFADRITVPFLVAVLVLFYLPIPFTAFYVRRKGVRMVPDRPGSKYWLISVLGSVPYVVFTFGAIVAFDEEAWTNGGLWGALVGGLVGGWLGVLGLRYAERRRRRRAEAAADEHE